MSDLKHFKLPDVGEGLTEAEIVSWKVKPGETVKINDVIVEIETAKSLVELPCPYAGTVVELFAAEGDTVDVGKPIISVETGEPASHREPEVGSPAEVLVPTPKADEAVEPGMIGGPAPGGRTSVLVGYGPRTTEAKRRPRKGSTPAGASPAAALVGVQHSFTPHATPPPGVAIEDASPAAPSALVAGSGPMSTSGRVLAKPPVRKLAKDRGIDLGDVTPTGAGGTITRADVESHGTDTSSLDSAESSAVESGGPLSWPGAEAAGERELRVPVKGVRKMTAQAMVLSAFTAPHVTEWITFDATRTMKMVGRLREHRDFRDVKVSPLLVVAKAVCLAIRRTPEINATWDEATQEIVIKRYVNLGIAAATPRGLLVPNIKDADQHSALQLAQAIGSLTAVAREGRTAPADQAGGTFTITNVGMFGVDAGTPIINPGESAILCVGAIRKQPWIIGTKIKPRWITTLALSFDHRVVDGQQGSKFLADVAEIVEDPGSALLF